jgi:hypothetical protein
VLQIFCFNSSMDHASIFCLLYRHASIFCLLYHLSIFATFDYFIKNPINNIYSHQNLIALSFVFPFSFLLYLSFIYFNQFNRCETSMVLSQFFKLGSTTQMLTTRTLIPMSTNTQTLLLCAPPKD